MKFNYDLIAKFTILFTTNILLLCIFTFQNLYSEENWNILKYWNWHSDITFKLILRYVCLYLFIQLLLGCCIVSSSSTAGEFYSLYSAWRHHSHLSFPTKQTRWPISIYFRHCRLCCHLTQETMLKSTHSIQYKPFVISYVCDVSVRHIFNILQYCCHCSHVRNSMLTLIGCLWIVHNVPHKHRICCLTDSKSVTWLLFSRSGNECGMFIYTVMSLTVKHICHLNSIISVFVQKKFNK